MPFYKCARCGEIFTEDEIEIERGISNAPMYMCTEDIEKCPYCGCEDFDETEDEDEDYE